MRVEQVTDKELIKSVILHDKIWKHVGDDSSRKELFDPPIVDDVYWLGAFDDELIGLYLTHKINHINYQIHVSILPEGYGERADVSCKKALDWMFTRTSCMKLSAEIPVSNKLAINFAKRNGFVEEGISKKSILKDDVIQDQIRLGLTKEDFYGVIYR